MRGFPLFCDVSQDVGRTPWGCVVPCLTTGSQIYDFSQDYCLPAAGNLALQGLPVSELTFGDLSQRDLTNMAGEAMFLGNIGSLLACMFLVESAPWWCTEG
jgi:hypothetical protein